MADAIGYFSKREDGQTKDVKFYVGDVYECRHCLMKVMRPWGKGLAHVQVTVATEEEKKSVFYDVEQVAWGSV